MLKSDLDEVKALRLRVKALEDELETLRKSSKDASLQAEKVAVEANESLRESEERLRTIFETSPIGIAIVSMKTNRRLYINPAMAELFGAESVDQLMEHDLKTTYADPADLDRMRSKVGDEFITEIEIERKRVDGTKWWCLLTRRLIDYEGEDALLTWHFDISRRKETEQKINKINEELEERVGERTRELGKSEKLFSAAFDQNAVGMAIRDVGPRDSRWRRVNQKFCDIFGYTDEEMLRLTSIDVSPPEEKHIAIEFNERLLKGEIESYSREKRYVRKNGDIFWANIWLSPILGPDGVPTQLIQVLQDITERKQAEEDLSRALLEAKQANQAKSEFLAAMSHDLRTPLNAILGFADILSHQYLGPIGKKYQEYAGDIHSSGELLLELVNDILDLSTIEAGKQPLVKEELATGEVVTECERIVEDKARSNGIDFETKVPEDLPPLYADRRAIKQILLNLLSNAVKFTPKGGKVKLSAKASKKNTTLKVADTGKGIPADDLPGLTDPFTKARDNPYLSEQGWGLGLSIAKSLVDLHGGTLDIKSKVGKGTTVTVTLPNGAA